jgi:hypothetical protein
MSPAVRLRHRYVTSALGLPRLIFVAQSVHIMKMTKFQTNSGQVGYLLAQYKLPRRWQWVHSLVWPRWYSWLFLKLVRLVFCHLNTGIVSSNPTQCMDVSSAFFCTVGRDFAKIWPPVRECYQTSSVFQNLDILQRAMASSCKLLDEEEA